MEIDPVLGGNLEKGTRSGAGSEDEVFTERTVVRGHTNPEETVVISCGTPEIVGNGSFGVVFRTKVKETGEEVVIKKVLQDRRFKNRELEIMKLISHPNLIDLRYFFLEQTDQDLYLNLIVDYMPMSLYQRLKEFITLHQPMDRYEIKIYMFQLFKALNYLHQVAKVCHRDIKPQNILVDPHSLLLKICDLGSAKQLKPNEPNVSYICSRYYRAPELIFGATNYTTKIDVWSAGCVMAELLLGQPIFPGESKIDQLVEIIKVLGTPTREEICSMNENYSEHKFPQIRPIPLNKIFKKETPETIELLYYIMKYDPNIRFSAIQCLFNSAYFNDIVNSNGSESNIQLTQSLKLMNFEHGELQGLSPDDMSRLNGKLI
ncbi:unnamed protein product [Kluyveromyces dobzhanskii CBS 2104]|uniref:WGS project CCBQ000000000 data, contig 00107 n=1 Tax=Kluyveromyces dobzhanskii CBS 2104 TaxID=1427455 RepID=A0A0A8L104_9SACH|nr:unnamed protein product [Kluyveromyces dobzhanskii CBS 2104]